MGVSRGIPAGCGSLDREVRGDGRGAGDVVAEDEADGAVRFPREGVPRDRACLVAPVVDVLVDAVAFAECGGAEDDLGVVFCVDLPAVDARDREGDGVAFVCGRDDAVFGEGRVGFADGSREERESAEGG